MPCLHPKDAWQVAPGVKPVFEKPVDSWKFQQIKIPCYRCIECKLNRSREWAIRCLHEKSLHDESCFITLTFNSEKIPADGSLDKDIFQRFMKRLRKAIAPRKIKYFMCGEYGEGLNHPHYHACIFGFDFPDRQYYKLSKAGSKLYKSRMLELLWTDPGDKKPYGFCDVGEVTFESAAYLARYCVKKITGPLADEHYTVVQGETGEIVRLRPEYIDMSRRPAIALDWWKKYKSDTDKDFITVNGVKMRTPRFYDRKLSEHFPEEYDELKLKRKAAALENPIDPARLEAREVIKLNRSKLLKRGIES